MPRLKPGIRAARGVAATLRDLVADFCRRHGGAQDPTTERHHNSILGGVIGATWIVPTPLGEWRVHEPADPDATTLVAVDTRFETPDRARAVLATHDRGGVLNPYSGKWNHGWSLDVAPATKPRALVELARSLMADFERAAAPIFAPAHAATAAPPGADLGEAYRGGPPTTKPAPVSCQAVVDDHDNPAYYAPMQRLTLPGDKPCSRRAAAKLGKLCLCAKHLQLAQEGMLRPDGRVLPKSTIRDIRNIRVGRRNRAGRQPDFQTETWHLNLKPKAL